MQLKLHAAFGFVTLSLLICWWPSIGEAATNVLVPGITQTGAITNQPAEFYEFMGTSGEVVTIFVQARSGTNVGPVRLIGPSGVILTNAARASQAEFRAVRLASTGKHRVRIESAQGGGRYGLTMIKLDGNNAKEVRELSPAPGETLLSTNSTGDLDPYEFSGSAGESVMVLMQKADGRVQFEPTIELYGPGGIFLTEVSAANEALLRYTQLTNSGLYTVVCRDAFSGPGAGGGDNTWYGLTILKLHGPNLVEFGETNRIEPGGALPVETGLGAGDMDVYTIPTTVGARLAVTMTSGSFQSAVAVYSPTGRLLGEVTAPETYVTARLDYTCPLEGGDHIIACRRLGKGPVRALPYTLAVDYDKRTPPDGAPPEFLQVTRCKNETLIFWPTNAVGFRLQSIPALSPPLGEVIWANLPPPYRGFGEFFYVTNAAKSGSRFFRLTKP